MNSYDPAAETPSLGSRWLWEIDSPDARCLVEVTEVSWNGEEWFIKTRVPAGPGSPAVECWNDLDRFREATTPVDDS